MTDLTDVAIVVPTLCRSSLGKLLESLTGCGPAPRQVVLVDDRRGDRLHAPSVPESLADRVVIRHGGGRGPAAARNTGWRAVSESVEWVVFLDDDVLVSTDWSVRLDEDLDQPADVAGVQGRITVPLPTGRRPTDWERSTAGLQTAAWITADMAYRRRVLAQVGGFDERFPRAYREDADLALRVQDAGWRLVCGRRETTHPVRPADRWVSVRVQAGNADDPLMRRVHGRDWRRRAQAPAGRRRAHLAVTGAAVVAAGAAVTRRRRLVGVAAASWLAATLQLAWARIAPGPRTRHEVLTMLLTSAALPPAASWHWLRGTWRHRHAGRWSPEPAARAVLFDRDGTLIHDVPYNGDPDQVRPVEGAVDAVAAVRAAGIRVGVVTNQSGVGRGLLSADQVARVNERVDRLFGGFDTWAVCPHIDEDGCGCRKPAPGLVRTAAAQLGVDPRETVVIGDIGADVGAARAAGARSVLVPTSHTRPEEIVAAPLVAADLREAVRLAMETSS